MIEFRDVHKQFGTQEVLAGISLRVLPAERVGVVGPNGSGKSTIFSLISGELTPDRGDVEIQRGLRVGMVRQQLRAHAFDGSLRAFALQTRPELDTLRDRIHALEHALEQPGDPARESHLRELGECQTRFEHLGGYTLPSRVEAALCSLGFQPGELDRPFRSFSGGWQMRAELVRTLLGDPDALLLDEPSNYLDLPAIEWLQKTLVSFPGTVLLISHDRHLLRSLTTVTVEVAAGQVTRYACGLDRYLVEREERVRIQEAAAKNQDRRREQIERFVERFRAKNTKATQVQSRLKMLEKMEEIRVPRLVSDAPYMRIAPPPHCGTEVLRLESVGHSYDGQRWVLDGVDLSFSRGDKVALVGFNGMGKTTLLRILAGSVTPAKGRRVLGHQVVPGYQSQDFAETMPPDQSVYRVVKQANPQLPERDLRNLLGGFGFSGDEIEKPVEVLSGGEKIRLAFARLFARPPNLLLLDEPTTHLDIQGRQTLEQALASYAGTVVLVSHDVTFVRAVASRILAFSPAGLQPYAGGYDYYREKAAAEPVSGVAEPRASAEDGAPGPENRKERRRMRADQRRELQQKTRVVRKEIAALEARIEAGEAERARVLEQISAGGATDYAALNTQLASLQRQIETDTAYWELRSQELAEIEQSLDPDAPPSGAGSGDG